MLDPVGLRICSERNWKRGRWPFTEEDAKERDLLCACGHRAHEHFYRGFTGSGFPQFGMCLGTLSVAMPVTAVRSRKCQKGKKAIKLVPHLTCKCQEFRANEDSPALTLTAQIQNTYPETVPSRIQPRDVVAMTIYAYLSAYDRLVSIPKLVKFVGMFVSAVLAIYGLSQFFLASTPHIEP